MEWLITLKDACVTYLQEAHPLWFIGAMTILPLVGMPVSPLWILSGVRFGFTWGTLIAILSTSVNITLSYGLASWWVRGFLERILSGRGIKVPVLAKDDQWKFILLCRLTPAIPMVLQNYLLGCARVQFLRYFLISLPILSAYCLALVMFGDSLTESRIWRVALAACLVGSLAVLIRLAWKWSRPRIDIPAPGEAPPAPNEHQTG